MRKESAHRDSVGLLDTSVVVDLDDELLARRLPRDLTISAITLAELAAGPLATTDAMERARRQQRLQQVEAAFDPIPFDGAAARSYGLIYAEVRAARRSSRRRFADLLIASIAHANDLPLYTRKEGDFSALNRLISVRAV